MSIVQYNGTVDDIIINSYSIHLSVISYFSGNRSGLTISKNVLKKSNYTIDDFKLGNKVVVLSYLQQDSVEVFSIKKYRKKPYRPFEKFKLNTSKL